MPRSSDAWINSGQLRPNAKATGQTSADMPFASCQHSIARYLYHLHLLPSPLFFSPLLSSPLISSHIISSSLSPLLPTTSHSLPPLFPSSLLSISHTTPIHKIAISSISPLLISISSPLHIFSYTSSHFVYTSFSPLLPPLRLTSMFISSPQLFTTTPFYSCTAYMST